MNLNHTFNAAYHHLLSEQTQKKGERIILVIAICSFIIHLITIGLSYFDVIHFSKTNGLTNNPIAAIYTPFSFILVYEVYLLIYYLPKSLTIYITKQYEIILLIIIRRLFKDLSNLTLSSDWFTIKYDLQFTYDLLTSIILFYLIYLFYKQGLKSKNSRLTEEANELGKTRYVKIKKIIAACLVPVVLVLAVYSFINWFIGVFKMPEASIELFKNINNVFFEQFFSLLVIVDVLLLLVSFFYSDQFHKVIRNSGFIISTILIRMSFTVECIMNNALIIVAIVFGLIILVIQNKFEAQIKQ